MACDPFWLFVNIAFFIGLGFTIIICGLWELAKLAWTRLPAAFHQISNGKRKAEIHRLQRLHANLDDIPMSPWPIKGGSH